MLNEEFDPVRVADSTRLCERLGATAGTTRRSSASRMEML